MKLKLLLTLVYSIFIVGISNAQVAVKHKTHVKTYAVKNYFSISMENDDINLFFGQNNYTLTDSNQVVDYRLFRPAFNIFDKFGNLHEFEILEFQFNNDNKSILSQNFDPDSARISANHDYVEEVRRFYLRYSYSFSLIHTNNFALYLGGGVQPYLNKVMQHSFPDDYHQSENSLVTIGVSLYVIPRIHIPINEKLFIDVNVLLPALKIENTKYTEQVIGDEKIYENDINQKYKGVRELAVGIGYKF